jgi:flagellar basal body-associated protein FliL
MSSQHQSPRRKIMSLIVIVGVVAVVLIIAIAAVILVMNNH